MNSRFYKAEIIFRVSVRHHTMVVNDTTVEKARSVVLPADTNYSQILEQVMKTIKNFYGRPM